MSWKNPLLDLLALALLGVCIYRLSRMIFRGETPFRDGWWKWNWEPKEDHPAGFWYQLVLHMLMALMFAFIIYADSKGWLR